MEIAGQCLWDAQALSLSLEQEPLPSSLAGHSRVWGHGDLPAPVWGPWRVRLGLGPLWVWNCPPTPHLPQAFRGVPYLCLMSLKPPVARQLQRLGTAAPGGLAHSLGLAQVCGGS